MTNTRNEIPNTKYQTMNKITIEELDKILTTAKEFNVEDGDFGAVCSSASGQDPDILLELTTESEDLLWEWKFLREDNQNPTVKGTTLYLHASPDCHNVGGLVAIKIQDKVSYVNFDEDYNPDMEEMRWRIALADAIRRPMGAIPDSAQGMLDPVDLEAAEQRRRYSESQPIPHDGNLDRHYLRVEFDRSVASGATVRQAPESLHECYIKWLEGRILAQVVTEHVATGRPEDISRPPHNLRHYSIDEVAECVVGLDDTTYTELWNIVAEAEKAGTDKPLGGDGSDGTTEEPIVSSDTYATDMGKAWGKLTEHARRNITEAAKKHHEHK